MPILWQFMSDRPAIDAVDVNGALAKSLGRRRQIDLPSTLIIGIPFKLSLYVPLQTWFFRVSSNSERRAKKCAYL